MNRALLVGINDYPSPLPRLDGCVNDVVAMADFLTESCGFVASDIRLLTDRRATTAAILERLVWLLSGLRPGDRILFHYSGHGAYLSTRNPQGEVDKLDECICPVDFSWSDAHVDQHAIRDKQFQAMFSRVPQGVQFVWISDCCHSGGLDDHSKPKTKHKAKTLIPPADIAWRNKTAKEKHLAALRFVHAVRDQNVALIAACGAHQDAEDGKFGGKPHGALTHFLLEKLREDDGLQIPLVELVEQVRLPLKRYKQSPQLEGSTDIMKSTFLKHAGKNARAVGQH